MMQFREVYIRDTKGEVSFLGGSGGAKLKKGKRLILVPYKGLSVRSFDFPFGSVSSIREAIKIQYIPISGGKDVEIFPVVHGKEGRRFLGSALVLPFEERASVEEDLADMGRSVIWALPFALAGEIDGNGSIVCIDDDGISSSIFIEGVPVLYRWQPKSRRSVENEIDWLKNYSERFSPLPSNLTVVDVSEEKVRLVNGASETLSKFPELGHYSLSRKVLDSAIVWESLIKSLEGFSRWMVLAGCLFLAAAVIRVEAEKNKITLIQEKAESLYVETFGSGRIRDPLSQAKGKLLEFSETPDFVSIERGLNVLARSWESIDKENEDIVLDSLRYSTDGMELIGTAQGVSSVQSLQKRLKEEGDGSVRLGDIQQIPGGGLRYSLEVRWSSR
ncbi:hypothetical protein L2W58_02955 [Dethiosulfovibrio sp. F2B]|uniref:type II secretion system protein GspL n=1 Tax=Dethiosulfovibrio faecalis TaxID=2720018 RepID=UPI001F2B7B2D|nr:type II secretion system protein GspL [Dethiosulfovibrio faecalis]MCF4150750.1 hypothetical protein [Dethiosulfovibrio faecalis]